MSRWTPAPTLVITAVLLAGLLGACGGDDPEPTSTESTAAAATTLELTLPAAQTGRCMPPSVENLQAQDTAFEGVVTAVAGGTATIDVTQTFKGEEVDTVTVDVPDGDLQDLVLAVDFEQGQTYLVSSLDGQVSVCGLSGQADGLLDDLYQRAYAG